MELTLTELLMKERRVEESFLGMSLTMFEVPEVVLIRS